MSKLTICAPLRIEARALRRGLDGHAAQAGDVTQPAVHIDIARVGYGPVRAAAAGQRIAQAEPDMVAVGGVGGAVAPGLRTGDIVVGSEVTDGGTTVSCPSAPLLAGELRRTGLTARVGQILTVDRLVKPGGHAALAKTGALAVDMETAPLLAGVGNRPAIVVRAISDTPEQSVLSPGIVSGGIAALRSLRLAAPALARWAAAVGPRKVLMASPRSFCAGVERAIEIVELALERYGRPVYVRKQIVHNVTVVADLEKRGAIFVDELSEVPDGAKVVFSAHGVSPEVRTEAERRGLTTVDATCPLVAKVHAEARRFASDGYLVALIGHSGHEEVEGTLGEAPGAMALVETAADVAELQPRDPRRVAYLMQTTLAADEALGIVDAITERFPAARGPGSDDICYATTNRQRAVQAIAARSDLVLVAGSANSSNSKRLVETSERAGTPAYLVDSAEDIQLGWLAGASTIGIAAGASAPPAIVEQMVDALSGLGSVQTEDVVVATENVQFGLPKELRL
ncbi:MAG TPA: 4-hydroxy-3-methylbut-2-enyl diphosphate reductase [Streptosporangiaceae bacterium]|nr:4-hydroxy-3-methylbut-2-enyl diphosphate reductase [Streptosporangiaceae bacterium]